jgi:hypothetical protein
VSKDGSRTSLGTAAHKTTKEERSVEMLGNTFVDSDEESDCAFSDDEDLGMFDSCGTDHINGANEEREARKREKRKARHERFRAACETGALPDCLNIFYGVCLCNLGEIFRGMKLFKVFETYIESGVYAVDVKRETGMNPTPNDMWQRPYEGPFSPTYLLQLAADGLCSRGNGPKGEEMAAGLLEKYADMEDAGPEEVNQLTCLQLRHGLLEFGSGAMVANVLDLAKRMVKIGRGTIRTLGKEEARRHEIVFIPCASRESVLFLRAFNALAEGRMRDQVVLEGKMWAELLTLANCRFLDRENVEYARERSSRKEDPASAARRRSPSFVRAEHQQPPSLARFAHHQQPPSLARLAHHQQPPSLARLAHHHLPSLARLSHPTSNLLLSRGSRTTNNLLLSRGSRTTNNLLLLRGSRTTNNPLLSRGSLRAAPPRTPSLPFPL